MLRDKVDRVGLVLLITGEYSRIYSFNVSEIRENASYFAKSKKPEPPDLSFERIFFFPTSIDEG